MCIVDKIVCFRKLINRVIVANGGDEFNGLLLFACFVGRGMAFWYHKFLYYNFLIIINNTN